MFGDQRIDHVATPCLEGRQRARLILLHDTAAANHVGGEDGGESAFHCGAPATTTLQPLILSWKRSNGELVRVTSRQPRAAAILPRQLGEEQLGPLDLLQPQYQLVPELLGALSPGPPHKDERPRAVVVAQQQ